MKKTIIKKYAELLIKCGLNVQKGQDVLIYADLDQPEFVALCVKEAYKAGAEYVGVEWGYPEISKLTTNKVKLSRLSKFTDVAKAKWEYRLQKNPAMLYLESADPDALKGMNQEKSSKVRAALYPYVWSYRSQIENKYQWCIAGVPSPKWAKKVFPELSKSKAVEALWEAILKTSRALEGDPIENWRQHNIELKQKTEKLNSLHLRSLHYTSSNGTDFKVGLLPNVIWLAGGEETAGSHIFYNPNIPSEECFTSPKKGVAEGIVYATKPLSYNGEIINGFWIRFKDGKAVEWGAEQNKELLTKMLTIDEGASYLGECALIPFDSPINNTGILFYNTLYDENASCHLAIGRGFTNLVQDYENYTEDQLHEMGINKSLTHVDFMIGSKDLKIVGTTEKGEDVVIFDNGNWAI